MVWVGLLWVCFSSYGGLRVCDVPLPELLETELSSETIPKTGFVLLDGEAGGITYRKVLLLGPPLE